MPVYGNNVALQTRFTLWHHNATVTQGNAIAFLVNANAFMNGYWRQNTGQINDKWEHPIYLRRGTYSFSMLYATSTDQGQLTLTLLKDAFANSFGTVEGYAAVAAINLIARFTGISVPSDGLYRLRGSIDGTNPSSSGNIFRITMIEFWRTGD